MLGMALLLFSFTARFDAGMFLLFFTGMGLIGEFSVINTTIQHGIDDRIRGRVMSIYVLMFRGTAPIGSFLMGYLGEQFGTPAAVRIGAIITLAAALALIIHRRHIPRTHLVAHRNLMSSRTQ